MIISRYFVASSPIEVDHLTPLEIQTMKTQLQAQGFCISPRPILNDKTRLELHQRYEALFRGNFETGIYPDEWHWRHGLSLPNVTREICNAYKADRVVASVVLNANLAAMAAALQGWSSVRIGQDDVIWKPPVTTVDANKAKQSNNPQTTIGDTTIGYHQDSAYISTNFVPYENNMLTVWIALDDANQETGCVEYVAGSHLWEASRAEQEEPTLGFFSSNNEEQSSHRHSLPSNASLDDIVSAPCPAGHVIFHHQDVWHGSGPNQSTTRHRRALVAHLLRGDVQWKPPQEDNNNLPPWSDTSYIYGRYRRSGTTQLEEDFFPILYASPESSLARTSWLDTYLATA